MLKELYTELDQFPKRLKRKDKTKFLDFISEKMESFGYETKYSKGRYIARCINLESDNDNSEVILGAHYDTPTILPFYFEFFFRLFGHTRQFLLMFAIFFLVAVLTPVFLKIEGLDCLLKAIKWTFYLSFLGMLIPNPNNKNDNTSGVATLLDIAEKISKNPDLKTKLKFVFFDNEELGLLGSLMQRNKWKKEGFDVSNKKFISIDCVAHGEIPVILYQKNPEIANQLSNAFFQNDTLSKVVRLPFYPVSDNYAFGKYGAANISWMNKSWIPGGYYIKNVHSPRDNYVDYDKIEIISDSVIDFIKNVEKEENEIQPT